MPSGNTLPTRVKPGSSKSTPMKGSQRRTVYIGLDFGTTYSGIAYAFSTSPDEIYTIQQWPKGTKQKAPKAPTVLRYPENDPIEWGYQVANNAEGRIIGVKLLLDPEQNEELFDPTGVGETRNQLRRLHKTPTDVSADYIAAIYKHAIDCMGNRLLKDYFDTFEKKFVLSVPAVWSDKAKDATHRAAIRAGIKPIQLIKEPEAAALFTCDQLMNKGLKIGDAFTVCDAGGGTVDLISYEIVHLEPLKMKELVAAKGGNAGSLVVNNRFEDFIKKKIGNQDIWNHLIRTQGWRSAMETFEDQVKPKFTGPGDDEVDISFHRGNLPDNARNRIDANTITLTGADMKGIFEPVVAKIKDLVKEQVNEVQIKLLTNNRSKEDAVVKAIFLVGGFGENQYLSQSLRDAHPGVQVVQPHNAWSAIVRGAVLSQLKGKPEVVSSIAQRHYGIEQNVPYIEQRDKARKNDRQYDEWEEIYRISRMSWYIKKGDELERKGLKRATFRSNFRTNPGPDELKFTYRLLTSDRERAPDFDDQSLTRNCSLPIDLSQFSRFFKTGVRKRDKKRFSYLDYDLVLKIEGARMVFEFWCEGQSYGQVLARY